MSFWKFILEKKVYLLLNIIVLLVGFIMVGLGLTCDKPTTSDGIFISIGTSLIAAGIVTILDLFRQLSIASLLEKHNNIISDAGIEWVYQKRDIDKYDSLVKNLNFELDIAGYSLGSFFDSYSKIIKSKVKDKKISVRILLVNPDSKYSLNRAEIEGRGKNGFKEKIETLTKFFEYVEGVEIRYLDAPLSTMIFRIDNVMFIGPHLYSAQSKATYTQELKNDHWLFDVHNNEFLEMWNDAAKERIEKKQV